MLAGCYYFCTHSYTRKIEQRYNRTTNKRQSEETNKKYIYTENPPNHNDVQKHKDISASKRVQAHAFVKTTQFKCCEKIFKIHILTFANCQTVENAKLEMEMLWDAAKDGGYAT